MWSGFLQMLGLRKAAYSPASGVWGPANTSGGVYPVPHTGEAGEAQAIASGLEWYSGGAPYPVVERAEDGRRAGDSPPVSFRRLGPELHIAHGNNQLYWCVRLVNRF